MKIQKVSEQDWHGRTVLVRVDYNVPLVSQRGKLVVGDPRRIKASYDTVNTLLKNGNKVVLLTHLGRPNPEDLVRFSLRPIFDFLQKNTAWNLFWLENPLDPKAKDLIDSLPLKSVVLVQNLRYFKGEKANDPDFALAVSKLGDCYVNDAFSASHRAHASIVSVPKLVPAAAGLTLLGELEALSKILAQPKRPLIIIVGGAKISDKIDSIVNLSKIADAILIGGGVANNFFRAVGLAIQKSYLQDVPADLNKIGLSYVDLAGNIIEDNLSERLLKDGYIPLPKIIYPVDVIAATSPDARKTQIVDLTSAQKISERGELMYLDIGPKTIRLYKELINQAKTVFWNGPLGYFEKPLFAKGTQKIAQATARAKAFSLVGGGDTIAALDRFHQLKGINYISLAGGATLEFLAGKKLPGLKILEN